MVFNNSSLSERLKFALNAMGISQTELAKMVNVKPQVIQYLTTGKCEKSKFTFDIAEALNIDVTWLATGKGDVPLFLQAEENYTKLPLLTISQVKKKKIDNAVLSDESINNWLPVNNNINSNSFAIRINDNSMVPMFGLDTIVIIEPTIQQQETLNCFALVYLAEEDYILFRKITVIDNVTMLLPLNQSLYKVVALKEKDIIIGVCKEARWSM